uniref:Uncharacterized protein n=1 Tax=Glossina austeni TaxID=7395 RepID=A0A1A9UTU3_GLOAU
MFGGGRIVSCVPQLVKFWDQICDLQKREDALRQMAIAFDAYSHLLQTFAKSNTTILVYITLNRFVLRHKEESVYHKRNREDDLQYESAPLCKRIKDLHSSNFEDTNLKLQQQLQQKKHIYEAIQGNNNSCHSQQQYLPKDIIVTQPLTPQHMESLPHHPIATYNPDLNEVENPYYYAKNKLLHELHLERLKRFSS